MIDLTTAESDLLTAQVAHQEAGKRFTTAIEAWLKAKILSLYPDAVTLVMEGEAGEEWNTTYRAIRVVAADGTVLADRADLDERDDERMDGPITWAEYTDAIPELDGPDGYMGETEIDLLA